MKRIDTPDAVANMFTEGDPAQQIPATTVSASIMNHMQEEIAKTVENAGLVVDQDEDHNGQGGGPDYEQLYQAIILLIKNGGEQIKFDCLNNQSSFTAITGLIFDKNDFHTVSFDMSIYRKTTGGVLRQSGRFTMMHDEVSDTWEYEYPSAFDGAEVEFNVTNAGQVEYKSNDLAGSNYVGDFRITNITTHKQ